MELQVQGHRAYAYTGGKPFDATLPAVVFLHGALHDHSVWTLPARWLAHHGHAVLAVDEPGHGRSEGAPTGSRVDREKRGTLPPLILGMSVLRHMRVYLAFDEKMIYFAKGASAAP